MHTKPTSAQSLTFDELAEKVSTWGRWGAGDERGTLNLLTPSAVLRGVAAVKTGEALSLAIPLDLGGPQDGTGIPGRINPVRTMLGINSPMSGDGNAAAYNDDIAVAPLQAGTHWDALSHISHRGTLYNGVPASTVTAAGASRLGVETFGSIVGRGILLDVAAHQSVDRLPADFAIDDEVLEECAAAQGVDVLPGDLILVRTGHMRLFLDGDITGYHSPTPGLSPGAALWFARKDVAAAATDTIAFELLPSAQPDIILPLHVLCLVHLGMPQGQNFNLEELGRACAADGRYDFMLSATPEPFTHGVGGMTNPVAIR